MSLATVGLYSAIFQLLWFLGAIVVAVLLLIAYSRQRNAAYIWLLMAAVVWPLLGRLATFALTMALPQMMAAHAYPAAYFALIQTGFGGALQIVDVLLFAITAQQFLAKQPRTETVYPMMPPQGEWPGR